MRRHRSTRILKLVLVVGAAGCFALTGASAELANHAFEKLQKKAESGSIAEQMQLAAAYGAGEGVPQDLTLAAHWYKVAAGYGNPAAQTQIGYMYQTGLGVQKDVAEGLRWYRLAAASGFALAKVNLGVMYLKGIVVPKDIATAVDLFHQAYERGSGVAAAYLGDLAYFGMDVPQDKAAAERWYVLGTKRGDPVSTYNLAALYLLEKEHARDVPKGMSYLRSAADHGYVPALYQLGLMLLRHPELRQSAGETRERLVQASGAGHWRASVLLGIMDRDGTDVAAEPKGAYYHFALATLQGGDAVQRLLEHDLQLLGGRLGVEEVKAQRGAAETWFAAHPRLLEFVAGGGRQDSPIPVLHTAESAADDIAQRAVPGSSAPTP